MVQNGAGRLAAKQKQVGSVLASVAGKKVIPVRGWRFAPACCAAQSVIRRGPCCAMPLLRLAWAAQFGSMPFRVEVDITSDGR